MSLASEYLALYKEFDQWAQNTMGVRSVKELQGDPSLWRYERRIEFFRHVRNMLTHDFHSADGEDMIAIQPSLVTNLRRLMEELQRTAWDKMVPARDVYKCRKEQLIAEVIRTMRDYQYTYVPITEEGRVIGLFSANTLLRLYDNSALQALPKDATIGDIIDVACLENSQDTCILCPPAMPMVDVQNLFATYSRNGERLDLIIFTENGTPDSPFLGLISAWDVLGA